MSDVCVVGSLMMDLIVRTPRFPAPGETVTGRSLVTLPGGKGFNQAVAANRAGASTAMVGCLGEDAFGQEFRDWLRREGIDATGVSSTNTAGTGVGMPVVDDSGQNAIVIVPQANLVADSAMVHGQEPVITAAKTLVLQLEIPDEANLAAAQVAKAAQATVLLNPAPFRPVPEELLELVDILIPNEHELEQLGAALGITADTVALLATAVRAQLGLDLVVTLGAAGALVVDADGITPVPAMRVEAVDTVGAGDTFIGNLAAHLARGVPLRAAVRTANAAAALSVTKVGGAASTPTTEQVDRFLATAGAAAC